MGDWGLERLQSRGRGQRLLGGKAHLPLHFFWLLRLDPQQNVGPHPHLTYDGAHVFRLKGSWDAGPLKPGCAPGGGGWCGAEVLWGPLPTQAARSKTWSKHQRVPSQWRVEGDRACPLT